MAEQTRSVHEIERDIEHERNELRHTIDEFYDSLTLEEIWNRVGGYIRRQGEMGEGFARVAREKPVALGLTALGIGLLLFGPKDNPSQFRRNGSDGRSRPDPYGRDYDEEARALVAEAEFEESRATGPEGQAARSDPWTAPHHRDQPSSGGRSAPGRTSSGSAERPATSAAPAATGSTPAAADGAAAGQRSGGASSKSGPAAGMSGTGRPGTSQGAASGSASGASTGAGTSGPSAKPSTGTSKPSGGTGAVSNKKNE